MILTHHEQALLLLRFLQQRQRKAELEQTLVLAEAQGSPLVILPRQHIFSWKKKLKVDAQAVRRELSEIERHPLSLSSQECLKIAAQLLQDAKQLGVACSGAEAGSTGKGIRRRDLTKL